MSFTVVTAAVSAARSCRGDCSAAKGCSLPLRETIVRSIGRVVYAPGILVCRACKRPLPTRHAFSLG